jgi:hypothetical protein
MESIKLPEKLWLAKAESVTTNTASYMAGAQAVLTSVEKMLKKQFDFAENELKDPRLYAGDIHSISAQTKLYKRLLKELTTLKP